MYKTIVIEKIKNVEERARAIEELINKEETEGWNLSEAIGIKHGAILIFAEDPAHRLNQSINKSFDGVKTKAKKIVEVIKGDEK